MILSLLIQGSVPPSPASAAPCAANFAPSSCLSLPAATHRPPGALHGASLAPDDFCLSPASVLLPTGSSATSAACALPAPMPVHSLAASPSGVLHSLDASHTLPPDCASGRPACATAAAPPALAPLAGSCPVPTFSSASKRRLVFTPGPRLTKRFTPG